MTEEMIPIAARALYPELIADKKRLWLTTLTLRYSAWLRCLGFTPASDFDWEGEGERTGTIYGTEAHMRLCGHTHESWMRLGGL